MAILVGYGGANEKKESLMPQEAFCCQKTDFASFASHVQLDLQYVKTPEFDRAFRNTGAGPHQGADAQEPCPLLYRYVLEKQVAVLQLAGAMSVGPMSFGGALEPCRTRNHTAVLCIALGHICCR